MSWSIGLSGKPEFVIEELVNASRIIDTALEDVHDMIGTDGRVTVSLSGSVYDSAETGKSGAGMNYSISREFPVEPKPEGQQ